MSEPEPTPAAPKPSRRKPFLLGCLTGGILSPILLTALIVLGAILYKPYSAAGIAANMEAPTLPMADFDWSIATDTGAELPMTEFQGRPFVLALWKPSCPACVAELPTIQALADAVADTDMAFIPLAMTKDDPAEIEAEARIAGLTMPYYLHHDTLPDAFATKTVPIVYVVDRRGTIVMSHHGATKWDDETVITYIRTIAEQPL